ncbi:YheC/YheD family protein [Bacillus sp. 165]|uniref:YheC/YheD family endospore coat-associated protein n=1 Tax=Bacillus sp. 165 TaxID=1529117 RepID=UPI001ADD2743|nr:YheC/YheD family protein [Bacillus sp. 165]MBO9128750.1 YheC/YheD family protein [Bacillus sp. 165]
MNHSAYSIVLGEREPDKVFIPYTFPNINSLHSISFGTKLFECAILPDYMSPNTITIGKDLFKELGIPYESKIHAFTKDDTIFLGPLIGIFTAGFTESYLRPLGERSMFFANLLTANQSFKAFIFVFGSHNINWQEGTITGYFYNENRWCQYDVPFPHVVYDRLPNRKTENHRAIARVKDRLQTEYLIPWFNPGFFNKWEIYKLLKNEQAVASYLPETHRFTNFETIEIMLSKYGHVYVKPMDGSLGSSIYQIFYSFEENVYYCRYRDNDENKLRKYQTLEKLINHLLGDRDLETFIVQQGIALKRVNQQPVDFRIHTNKNIQGNWQLSAIAAKIAGQGSMTTHINNGGDVKTLEEIFPDYTEREQVRENLVKATLLLSECIDRQIEGYIGEIGFDIGLDKNGKVWLFEANSKPGRSIFDYPKLKDSDRLTKELFFAYALYLTEKSLLQPDELFER